MSNVTEGENVLQQFVEQSIKSKEAYIASTKEKFKFIESWDIHDGDRLHKLQRIHLLHMWVANIMNDWQKWLRDINRVATFSEEETDIALKFFYELTKCVLTFEIAFSGEKMSEDIVKMQESLRINTTEKRPKSYVA